jgi:hypothetical protein
MTGHVDVRFVAGGGEVLKEASSPQIGIYRSSPGKGPKLTPFEIQVNYTPPEDSRLILAYHAGERPCKQEARPSGGGERPAPSPSPLKPAPECP